MPEPPADAAPKSLKSILETGKPLMMKMEGPPPDMMEAVQKALAEKPWLK